MNKFILALLPLPLALGCSGDATDTHGADTASGTPAPTAEPMLPERFWSAGASADARNVFDLREGELDGEQVVVRGTVKEFVDGLAAFVLVEDTLQSCDEIPGDECPTPWDYCCADPTELARGTAFVEFQEDGRPGPWVIEGFHDLAQLSEVVVTGTLQVDDAENMSILATSIRLQ